jgi:hypothetical protein
MKTAAWRVRAGVLVLLGAIVVHELRYALAGAHADAHAHAYMGRLVPLACALVVLAAIEFAVRLGLRRRMDTRALESAGVRWLALGTLLLAIFAMQETAEMFAEHGRLDLVDSLIVHGGWLAAPLSYAVGAVIALLLRGAEALLARTGRRAWGDARAPEPHRPLRRPSAARLRVIACNLAGRAPPPVVN